MRKEPTSSSAYCAQSGQAQRCNNCTIAALCGGLGSQQLFRVVVQDEFMTRGFGEFSLYLQAFRDVCLFCWLSFSKPTAFLPILLLFPLSCSFFQGCHRCSKCSFQTMCFHLPFGHWAFSAQTSCLSSDFHIRYLPWTSAFVTDSPLHWVSA